MAMEPSLVLDPLALTALGFLGVVLAMSIGLFIWLMLPKADKPRKKPAS